MVGGGMREVSQSKETTGPPTYLFKVIAIGAGGAGKSSIIHKFSHDLFNPVYIPTIGIDFAIKKVEISGGEIAKLQIWDTPGQDEHRNLTLSYYRGAQGLVIACDLTDEDCLKKARGWHREGKSLTHDSAMILAGTKSDLINDRKVTTEEFTAFAQELGLLHIETSSLTGENIHQMFEILLESMITIKKENQFKNPAKGVKSVRPLQKYNKGEKQSSDSGAGQKSKTCTIL